MTPGSLPFEYPFRWKDLAERFGVDEATISYLEQRDRDLEDFLSKPPRVGSSFMRRSVNQSVPTAGSAAYPVGYTRVDFDTIEMDDLGGVDASTDTFTATVAGAYLVTANISWAPNVTGNRVLIVGLNAAVLVSTSSAALGGGYTTNQNAVTMVDLAVGDQIVLDVLQNSGGALDLEASGVQPHLSASLLRASE